jgi:hypothetical protein
MAGAVKAGQKKYRFGTSQFSLTKLIAPAENPLKSARKRKYTDLELCKSQKRTESSLAQPAVMLMSRELHNWLLFMALKTAITASQNRTLVLCPKIFRKRFSIPQSFPQPRPTFPPVSASPTP